MPAQTVIKVRRDTAANWTSANPTLASGEIGFETDTNKLKVGNGSTAWTSLSYASGAGGAVISTTAPTGVEAGTIWFDSNTGISYVYYDSTWVELAPAVVGPQGPAGPSGTIAVTAPLTNSGTSTAAVLGIDANYLGNTAGKNKIINGAFDYWQRGTSFTGLNSSTLSSAAYTADRWRSEIYSGTLTVTQQTFTAGEIAGQDGKYYMRLTPTAQGDITMVTKIEDVRTLAGQTVTLSFWAKASSSTALQYVLFRQSFGTGGSADVYTTNYLSSVTLTTSWQRLSVTLDLPSIVGKTIGDGSALSLRIDTSETFTGNLDIWGVQLEAGSVATPFSRNASSIQGELAACQRYYEIGDAVGPEIFSGDITSGSAYYFTRRFAVTKRITPTIAITSHAASGFPATTVADSISTAAFREGRVATVTVNGGYFISTWTASAEL